MRVAVLHNAVGDGAAEDERDVLIQVEAVCEALRALGHRPAVLPCTADLPDLRRRLAASAADRVFNLVEGLEGQGRLIAVVPGLLDSLDLAYTGAPAEALYLTSNKLLAKNWLRCAGLPTPDWIALGPFALPGAGAPETGRFIVKSVWEHASIGLEEDSVIPAEQVVARSQRLGGSCFAEAFVEGREFNLSVLAGPDGPMVLPPAEIDFSDFPDDKLKIVGYRAKWDAASFEYHHTPRRFEFPDADRPLLDELRDLSLRCWELFGLRGWARVDFRVDRDNRPWILEVNANPCLSPDAGFAAAVAQAGLSFEEAVDRILANVAPGRQTPGDDRALAPSDLQTKVTLRPEVRPADRDRVRAIVEAAGLFHPHEVAVAVELVEERLLRGEASGYHFIFAELEDHTVGYACHGPIACTASSHDLYWIAVDPDYQGLGLGRRLLDEVERGIAEAGGTRVYVETSAREAYNPTRQFYAHHGYQLVSLLEDFYAPGDGKATYEKKLR